MRLPLFQVDAFTDRPFAGNPAAVCLLERPAEEKWMQQVAAEMNLSETAFLSPEDGGHRLRWFTPAVEVPLCGHATLASAHALWESGRLRPDEPARFHTASGLLTAVRDGEDICMDFPARPVEPAEPPPDLVRALAVTPEEVGRNGLDYLVRVRTEAAVRELRPDIALVGRLPVRGVIVTAAAEMPGYDFVSRFFAPSAGIAEDPVTGAAHCALGPFWRDRLGKDTFRAYQASPRGGTVGVWVRGGRVDLSGRAVTVFRGELLGGSST
jgi:PhzF family phenazine biosynthesis protein